MPTRADIVRVARECIGTRWHHQGRVVGVGLDCVGVLFHVAHTLGLSEFEYGNYPRRPNGMLEPLLEEHMDRIAVEDAGDGDVLMMRWREDPQHVAVRTPVGIVHAHALARKCVEQPMDAIWRSRTVGAFRFRGVTP